jgi:hexosaminidase
MRKKMQNLSAVALALGVMLGLTACERTDLARASLIPKPVSVIATGGAFELTEGIDIYVQGESDELRQIGQYLADKLNPATGFGIEVKTAAEMRGPGNIFLALAGGDPELGEEGYELTITEEQVNLHANKPAGLFHGIQTLRQLFPAAIERSEIRPGPWRLATGVIRDYPVYEYRGLMLDTARYFFAADEVRRYIDRLAYYKMNVLHLHLSDDQGWRIEIKSWPKLAKHGGKTSVGGRRGGYYTQEQYADIVAYAQRRYVTVIPEIDMPGHTHAALASAASLNCDGKSPELYTGIEVGFSTLCIHNKTTYEFVDDVIRELAALTPGPYLHIGGDEARATHGEDYVFFMSRVQDIVAAHGKKVLAWEEIAAAPLRPGTVVQYWAKPEHAIKGIGQGARVLMSPAARAYLDMQYDAASRHGLHWAGYIEADQAYDWDPATLVPEIGKANIIGIEAPLWAETVTDSQAAEYLVFPRLLGYAEIGWTPKERRNWRDYRTRLAAHGERIKAMNIGYYPSKLVPWNTASEK